LFIDVFLSVGQVQSAKQRLFIDAVQTLLIAHDLVPRTVVRTDFTDRKPIRHITEVLRKCSGTIIVALERFHFVRGVEFRISPKAVELTNVSLPTVWNQIEASIAYTLGQPLLAIVETGLRREGLLEEGYDWYVNWIDFNPSRLTEPEFLATFSEWKSSVEKYQFEQFARGT